MSIFRRLADFAAGKQKPQEPTPLITVHNQPGQYGSRAPADARKNGSGFVELSRLEGNAATKFSSGEDWKLSRKPVPLISDVRVNTTTPTPAVPRGGLPYGESPSVRGVEPAPVKFRSTGADTPSAAGSLPAGQQSGSDGKVKR